MAKTRSVEELEKTLNKKKTAIPVHIVDNTTKPTSGSDAYFCYWDETPAEAFERNEKISSDELIEKMNNYRKSKEDNIAGKPSPSNGEETIPLQYAISGEDDNDSAFGKLSEKDQKDIKDSLDATRKMFAKTVNDFDNVIEKISDESYYNEIFDPALTRKWKEHVNKVNNWIANHKGFPEPIAKAFLLEEYPDSKEMMENLSPDEQAFKSIINKMFSTYQKKNSDYGNAFDKSFQKYGMTALLLRLGDKFNRLESLADKKAQVEDESIEDTLLDLANYAILGIIALRKKDKVK